MKNIFVDTNIIIDFISLRQPFGDAALKLFDLASKKKVKLYASSHSIATTHYILKKIYPEKKIRQTLDALLDFLSIVPVTEDILRKALRSAHKDYEDAIQIFCAHAIKEIFAIVTRDFKDFSTSEIRVFSSEEIIRMV